MDEGEADSGIEMAAGGNGETADPADSDARGSRGKIGSAEAAVSSAEAMEDLKCNGTGGQKMPHSMRWNNERVPWQYNGC